MAITVAELLAEPQLGLTLIAGADGLDKRITWAHTSDLPRLWEWVTGGEIMMTNGLSIPSDAPGQVALAQALVDAGASGLAIGEKMHAPALQPEFLAACNALALPLVNVPYPLPFIAIARTVAESSLLEESRRLRQTARIYDLLRLTDTTGNHWQSLVQGVAAEVDSRLFVVDLRCLHPWHPEGEPLPAMVRSEVEPLTRNVAAGSKTFRWHMVGNHHFLLVGIPTHPNALLIVMPHAEPHPDAVVLLHAATVLGLELSRTVLALEGQRRLGAEFLLQAFEGRYGVAEMESHLTAFGIPSQEFLVLSISSQDDGHLEDIDLELWRHGFPAVVVRRHNKLHAVVSAKCPLEMVLHAVPADVRLGVSTPSSVNELQQALQESLWALGTAGNGPEQLVSYSEGPSWLGLTSYEQGAAIVKRLLGPIIEYERGRQPDLMITLRTFLQLQRSWAKTAEALFTHRQTIIYRIKKISELTGLDMAETSTLAQLWFALQINEAMDVQIHTGRSPNSL